VTRPTAERGSRSRDPAAWEERIRDARGRRVVFLAHCLLNENTRYLGGAMRGGAIREIVEPCLRHEIGIVQLPCPEQHAWGGVLKRRLLLFFGARGRLRYRLRGALLPVMLWYTARVYRRLAREVATQIQDYERAGVAVLGIVGVDASPSCGVQKTLDVAEALDRLGRLERDAATADAVNAIIRATAVAGRGLYVDLLTKELAARGLSVPLIAHDLVAELDGKGSTADVESLLGAAVRT